MIDTKPVHLKFDKANRIIRVYDGTRSLALSRAEKHDLIYSKIRYLRGVKSDIAYVISHNYLKIKTDS